MLDSYFIIALAFFALDSIISLIILWKTGCPTIHKRIRAFRSWRVCYIIPLSPLFFYVLMVYLCARWNYYLMGYTTEQINRAVANFLK